MTILYLILITLECHAKISLYVLFLFTRLSMGNKSMKLSSVNNTHFTASGGTHPKCHLDVSYLLLDDNLYVANYGIHYSQPLISSWIVFQEYYLRKLDLLSKYSTMLSERIQSLLPSDFPEPAHSVFSRYQPLTAKYFQSVLPVFWIHSKYIN